MRHEVRRGVMLLVKVAGGGGEGKIKFKKKKKGNRLVCSPGGVSGASAHVRRCGAGGTDCAGAEPGSSSLSLSILR